MKSKLIIVPVLLSISFGIWFIWNKKSLDVPASEELSHERVAKDQSSSESSRGVARAGKMQPKLHPGTSTSQTKPIDKGLDLNTLSLDQIQELVQQKFGESDKAHPFESWGEEDKKLFLDIYTLGSGDQFLPNLEAYTSPIEESQNKELNKNLLASLKGKWKSSYLSDPRENDAFAFYFLEITDKGYFLSLRDNNIDYLSTRSDSLTKDVKTGGAQLPPNLLLTLKAKPEGRYKHNIYLHVFASESHEALLANLYNTDQWLEKPFYIQADKLVFQRVYE
jgi:hypothetical protein